MAKNANILTLFAEDIREEKTEQLSLIGLFDDVLQVGEFPFIVSKLALLITLSTLLDDPFVPKSFRIFLEGGATLMAQDLPNDIAEVQQKSMIEIKRNEPDREWVSMRIRVAMNNLKINEKSVLCIEAADASGIVVSSNKLKFTQRATQPTPSISI